MKRKAIKRIFEIFAQKNPHPQTELYWTNPYTLLVAVVLSAQATDKSVNKVTRGLFERLTSPQDLLELGEEALRQSIKTIGLYTTKAKNLIKLSELLVTHYQGAVPSQREELEKLPGVGRKTANVVLNVAFDQATIPVDTHVFRVSRRLGLSHGATPLAVEKDLMRVVPRAFQGHAHHWLILHGRYVCKAQRPLCGECPVQSLCLYPFKTIPKEETAPLKSGFSFFL